MPSKEARLQLAKLLSQHLSGFGECFHEQILCPVCMTALHVKDDSDILTAGHIVPESTGGKDWTILCKTCNSEFGKRQDKWFGEYLCVLKNPEGTFLHAKSKSKYLSVNGVPISGKIGVSEIDGAVEIILPINRNPPGKVDSVPLGETLTVEFTPELVKHVNEIQVGYITAAYLTWFKEIGYNWVMQSSQELVRRQILECDYTLDGAKVVDLQGDQLHQPAIGVLVESGLVYPCCLMYDRLVVFPPPNVSNAASLRATSFSAAAEIHLLGLRILNLPYSVNFDGGIAVLPDMLRKNPPIPKYMVHVFADANRDVQWLTLME